MRIAVIGVSGMLGSMAFRLLGERYPGKVFGTARSAPSKGIIPRDGGTVVSGIDIGDVDALSGFLQQYRPEVVLNCVGVVKQLASANDPLTALPVNALFPHRLARLCDLAGARLVHISTDCVFSGRRGDYRESDIPDAEDLYGRSKLLGEVDYPNAVTLRTSIIGPELATQNGLVEWFLHARGPVKGYRRAIFSGLTTDELVRVIDRHIIPHPKLRGVYHVSVNPISKYDLLKVIATTYSKCGQIEPDDSVKIDRSLDSSRFREATDYSPPEWPWLIQRMRELDPIPNRR